MWNGSNNNPERLLVLLISYALVGVVGLIDYLTGDYSILIFYMLPVFVAAWQMGRWGAVHMSLAAGLARTLSDYSNYTSTMKYRNSLQDTAFLLVVGLLIAFTRKVLDDAHE